jgi:hypothetical protein
MVVMREGILTFTRIDETALLVRRKERIRHFYQCYVTDIYGELKMAERTGLEPATPGVTGRYSNQLNYRSALYYFSQRTLGG